MALTSSGTIYSWGLNTTPNFSFDALGTGDPEPFDSTPAPVNLGNTLQATAMIEGVHQPGGMAIVHRSTVVTRPDAR